MPNTRRGFLITTASAGCLPASQATSPAIAEETTDLSKFRAAVLAGDLPAVNSYLDRDPAFVYARDSQGNSVFTLASLAGQTQVAEVLTRRGVVLDIFEAAASGNVQRATELNKTAPGIVHSRSADGRTPLHFAAAAGKPAMVMFLNGQGVDLSASPESPMVAVADHPDVAIAEDMARTLLGNGSDPNARRKDGCSLLHLAAARGNQAVVRLLIHRGASVDAKDASGRTPLQVASGAAVQVLRNAAEIDIAYYGGRYAHDVRGNKVTRDDTEGLPQDFINQFVTIAHRDFEQVKLLHKKCPSLLSTRAIWDELAIEAAAHMGLMPMAEYLAAEGSPVSTCTAVIINAAGLVKKAINEDRNRLRERGAHDLPLLSFTAFGKERAELADLLLESGADVSVRGFGQTVLHLAAVKGYVDLAKVLLDHGADVNATVKTSNGPATALAVARRQQNTKMVDLLVSRGGRT